MPLHTTNYTDTFIEVAADTKATIAEIPPAKKQKTAANLQFEMIIKHPYQYTSDDVLFQVFAEKKELSKSDYKKAREEFFSKGQACFRTSPLTKRYGWGLHSDAAGKIALYAMESAEYKNLSTDKSLTVVKAMRSSK